MPNLRINETDSATVTTQEALRKINHVLNSPPASRNLEIVIDQSDEVIRLPREIATILREILINSVAGKSVSVIPNQAELTTQEAADLLNVSRPHVVKLLDEGILPGHKAGTHRRIYAADVQAYKHQREIDTRAAADDLTELTEELGLYE